MRYIEINGGINVPLNEEEDILVNKIKEETKLTKESLGEREREVARRLVSRGILEHEKIDNEWSYSVNLLKRVERT